MTRQGIEAFIRRAAKRFGLDIRRYRPNSSEAWQLNAMLAAHGVNVVFDVGANVGQYAQSLREAGYGGRIVSFEPLPAAHAQLVAASSKDPRWDIAPRTAVGGEDGEVDLHVAGNSVSSSILDMLEAHASAAPKSRYTGRTHVSLRRLDSLASSYLREDSIPFLKIDTQGYEDRVLLGASNLLKQVVGLQLELSLVPLYEGQRLYADMIGQIQADGFELWSLWPGFIDSGNGRLLQLDAVLFRR
jgi:FkbM family methyltransferase